MKKLEDYHWICPEPFTNIYTSTLGIMSPCCVLYKHEGMLNLGYSEEEMIFNAEDNSHYDFWNSEVMRRLRKAMREGNDEDYVNEVCKICKIQESSGNSSHRQFYLKRFDEIFQDKKEELENIIATDSYPSFYHSAEMNHVAGNVCNLACHFCRDTSSHTWEKEAILLGETNEGGPIVKNKNIVNSDNKFDKDLYEIVNKAVELKFTGGEPLIGNKLYKILSMVESPENHTVRMITNATYSVDKFISETKKFKSTTVNVSLEGIGDFNNYLRYPSDFKVMEENIYKLFSSHVQLYITPTINALNAGRLYELAELFGEDNITQGSYVGDCYYSINSIPPDIKDMYLNKLYSYGKYGIVKTVIRYLENSQFSEYDMYGMLKAVRRRDKHRGTNLLDHVPEWKKYYENCIDH